MKLKCIEYIIIGSVIFGKIIFIGYGHEVKRCYIKLMMKMIWKRFLKAIRGNRKENWGKKQVREMAKLGGKLILM